MNKKTWLYFYGENVQHLKKTITLIGLMGCGKSAIGKRLGKFLSVPFIDSDTRIVEKIGTSIVEIFKHKGEAYFRSVEKEVIQDLINEPPCILATGGGAFIQDDVRALLQEHTYTIWLNADIDVLFERVSRKKTRPILEKGNKRAILAELIKARYPIYAQANFEVHSRNVPHQKIIDEIVEQLYAKDLLINNNEPAHG